MSPLQIQDPYWSRQSDRWEMVPRQDPVVWPSEVPPGPNALSDPQLKDYETQGYHHSRQLISTSQASDLLEEAKRLAAAAVVEKPPGTIIEPGSGAVRSLFQLHQVSEAFRNLAQDSRIIDKVQQMLGSEVYVHQSRINFKPDFDGKEFFWHSDFETWHMEDGMPSMRAVSVSISLTETHEFNGPLIVLPGSHHWFVRCIGETPENHYEVSLRKQDIGVPSREAMAEMVNECGMIAPKGKPGNGLFFECNLMHGSAGNVSPHPRTNFFIVYNSVENAVQSPYAGTAPRPEFLCQRNVIPVSQLS